ncbi:MAG: PLP-dependent transferase, partial [Parvularculaceae bacterium]
PDCRAVTLKAQEKTLQLGLECDLIIEAPLMYVDKAGTWALAESLGGVESLIEHPGVMTHASIPPERRKELGIDDALVRLSVGVEDAGDLRRDLDQALAGL